MYYILYIDRLFFLNLGMNFFALSLTNIFLGRRAGWLRIFVSAGMGAAGCIGVLFIPGLPYIVKMLAGFLGISLIMVWVLFPKENFSFFIKALTSLYGFSFLLGGVLIFLKKFCEPKGNNFILTMLLPSAAVCFLLCFILKHRGRVQNECEVLLFFEGRQVKIKAFIDSGNMLTEPISQKPVSVLDGETLKEMGMQMPEEKCRAIPYHSVGRQNGILMGYEFPQMIIHKQNTDILIEKAMVAVSEEPLFTSGKYQMLLHPKLLEEGTEHKRKKILTDKKDLEEFT